MEISLKDDFITEQHSPLSIPHSLKGKAVMFLRDSFTKVNLLFSRLHFHFLTSHMLNTSAAAQL